MTTQIQTPAIQVIPAPSKYQKDVLAFVERYSAKNLFVKAVAGAGKTTVLRQLARKLQELAGNRRVLFVAFNKIIADGLKVKLAADGCSNIDCSTIHAFGMKALQRAYTDYQQAQAMKARKAGKPVPSAPKWQEVDKEKYSVLCADVMAPYESQLIEFNEALNGLKRLVNYAQLTLTDPKNEDALRDLVFHYNLEIEVADTFVWDIIWTSVSPVLDLGKKVWIEKGIVDFNDMVYLTARLKEVKVPLYDDVMVDESQDLNRAQLAVIRKAGKRFIMVGDPRQAIYGFSGADTDSVNEIVAALDCTVLPLSICYRCPKWVARLAAQVVPQIEASETAEEGHVERIELERFRAQVADRENIVLCRTTAPLVAECLRLIREGIKARVRGRDLGRGLVAIVKKIKKTYKGVSMDTIEHYLQEYASRQRAVLEGKKDAEEKIAALNDRIETVQAFIEGYIIDQANGTIDGFYEYVNSKFSDDENGAVILSTVHRAKGLEFDNVYILKGEQMPHKMAKADWQIEQEMNLLYVAITRTKKNLYFVGIVPASLNIEAARAETVLALAS